MSNLKRVTITGADDSTDLQDIYSISRKFPFVEWGILISKRQEGTPRFPSRPWIDWFSSMAHDQKWAVSTHICGEWVRQLLRGKIVWHELPCCLAVSDRVQVNFHAEEHISTAAMGDSLQEKREKEFIFQWDGVNDHLAYAAKGYGLKSSALFDTSGGGGILPKEWPYPATGLDCGYAGGLGPGNVVEQVHKIEEVCGRPYWIDMERRVRTDDDRALDFAKVEMVLQLMLEDFID